MSKPFALYKKGELHYIGMHKDEADCWKVALGWPSPEEIEWEKKTNGLICLPVRVIAPADRLGSVRCPRCWEVMSAPAAPAGTVKESLTPAPLTDEQIDQLFGPTGDSDRARWLRDEALKIARAIERAHGITKGGAQP